MFERLIDLLVSIFDKLIPFAVMEPYQAGVICRFGKFVRVMEPGTFNWIWPFGIDAVAHDNIAMRAVNLGDSSTTTKDEVQIAFNPIITFAISDIKKALLDIEDVADSIRDACLGTIGVTLSSQTWENLQDGEKVSEMLTAVCRKRGWKWGVEILSVQLATLAKCRTVRLMQSGLVHQKHVA